MVGMMPEARQTQTNVEFGMRSAECRMRNVEVVGLAAWGKRMARLGKAAKSSLISNRAVAPVVSGTMRRTRMRFETLAGRARIVVALGVGIILCFGAFVGMPTLGAPTGNEPAQRPGPEQA